MWGNGGRFKQAVGIASTSLAHLRFGRFMTWVRVTTVGSHNSHFTLSVIKAQPAWGMM